MQRRRFLKNAAIALAGAGMGPLAVASATMDRVECFVAGTPFTNVRIEDLNEGGRISVRHAKYQGKVCFEVVDDVQGRIGYIPRRLVETFAGKSVAFAWITRLNEHAVPWKRVKIAVVFNARQAMSALE